MTTRNQSLLFSRSILAFSVSIKNKISPLRSLLAVITYFITSFSSLILITAIIFLISFFSTASFSSRLYIIIFTFLRFVSILYDGFRTRLSGAGIIIIIWL